MMNNYITLYENTLLKEDCQNLINKFEKYTAYHDYKKIESSDGWKMQFTQLHLANHKEFEEENHKLKALFIKAIAAYRKEHNIQSYQWPKNFQLEPLRMKRYMPNSDDIFDEHVEVTNLQTSKRFMVALIYLNDNFKDGETDFVQLKIKIKPKQGNMLLFPATWNWMHKAHPVTGNNPKYFVGTLLHYVDE